MRTPAALLVLTLSATAAAAEDLAAGISTDIIEISSNFAGTSIVIFGAISDDDPFASAAGRDVVVVVRAPDERVIVRRKERIAGAWINTQQVAFDDLPGYYFVASTRPLTEIASRQTMERFAIGTFNLRGKPVDEIAAEEAQAFLSAAIRKRKDEGLYVETPTGIDFLSHALFRVRVPIPATVPPGQYKAEVYLFRDGNVVSAQSTPLYVDKTGLERRLYNLAYSMPFLYGISSVAIAFLLGWLASVLFRDE